MCGIAGVFHADGRPASPEVLQRMTWAIRHRGPDGEGVLVDGNVGLGHRRLAIIDPTEAGRQPMTTPDGRVTISYNGELYNYLDLKRELSQLGHRFASASDTEVVLAAWAEWGARSLDRFNGIFAFAIWDRRDRSLALVRDRYGVKPLYYTLQGRCVIFGSEVKAILEHPLAHAEMDCEGLVEYLTFQNFFTDRTLFKGVRLLPAGTWLRLSEDRAPELETPTRYWDFCFSEPESPASEDEYVEEFHAHFQNAVKRQLMSDVGVSTYLSGGIDSGSITAVAAREVPFIRSFTGGFDVHSASGVELGFDERENAEHMSYLFKTEHYEMVLKAGDMERVMPRLGWHLEEPRVGQSYPNFFVAQLASRFSKVVLSGAGGDEIFAGYPWRYYRAVAADDFDDFVSRYYAFWQRMVPDARMPALLEPLGAACAGLDTREIFRSVFRRDGSKLERPEDYVNHCLHLEAKTFLHGLLVVEDKLSMAHGLETRVPFLDNDLVDFGMRVPVRLKLANLGEVVRLNENEVGQKVERYFERTRDGKLLMRKAMAAYVPPEVSQRVKQGFSGPDHSWFKGDSIDFVRRRICTPEARIYRYLAHDTARDLIDEHLLGKHNRRLLIWSLLSLEQFCDDFL
jgi:asparagine synthase (glutamine-hydrolysing)